MKLSLGITPRDYSVAGGVTYDADALAYFTANTAITSDADKDAINTFYLGLKSDGIYTNLKAMYLWKWGSASADKWNMINPLDTDAAFRCNFATGFTYSTSGITGNGTSSYINTFFNPNSVSGITLNNISGGFYSRTSRTGSNTLYSFGTNTSGGTNRLGIRLRTATSPGDLMVYNCNDSTNILLSNTDTRGFFQVSRINSANVNAGKNTYSNYSSTSNIMPNLNIPFFANNNNGTISGYETVQSPFGYLGTGLTLTQMSNFYTRVNTLMTYFGINV